MANRFKRYTPYVVLALVSFLLGGFAVSLTIQNHLSFADSPSGTPAAQEAARPDSKYYESGRGASLYDPYAIADIAEEVSPAVVFVKATWPKPEPAGRPYDGFYSDPFFRYFFGDSFFPFPIPQDPGQPVSQGTGFIINEEGYILTNQHVVGSPGEGQKITVKLTTGDYTGELEAKLVGADYKLDLAVLKIDKPKELAKLPYAKLGNSDKSRPGEWAIAIGNPYGEEYEHTVTVGVISAKGREIKIPDQERGTYREYKNLMQTDASINPGNSGGPLINMKGEVIGINTAINAQAQGIGFAIPINTAKEVVDELITKGKVERPGGPWLGVRLFTSISKDAVAYFDLPDDKGAMVAEVVAGGPAEKAGLQTYDVIRKVNKTDIRSVKDLQDAIAKLKPGDEAVLVVIRNGETEFVTVTIGEQPEELR